MTPIGIQLTLGGDREVETGLRRVSGAMDTVGGAADSLKRAVGGLAGAFAGAISVREFVQAADAVTTLQNQLKLATGGAQQAATAYSALFEIAQRSRTGFVELGTTFASISTAAADLGVSQQRLLTVTEAIGNAVTISGTGAQAAQAALVQLGQGLASGTLRGEELNSVMEQTPRLAKALADGLGVTRGELRALGADGLITAEQVIKALESQSAVLQKEVGDSVMTVGQAFTNMRNSTVKAAGDIDSASGATSLLAEAIGDVASAMDALGKNAVVFDTMKTAGETLKVLYNNVAFVFSTLGREIGGIAAQAAAISRGDFRGAGVIRQELIADAAAARARLDASDAATLRRPASTVGEAVDTRAEDARLARLTNEMRMAAADEKRLAEIRRELAGVSKDYLPTLTELHRQYEAGRIPLAEYQRLVADLATKNYKNDTSGASALKQEQGNYESLVASIKTRIAQNDEELRYSGRLTESDKLRVKMLAELEAGTKTLSAAHKGRALALLDILGAQERDIQATKRAVAAYQEQAEIQAELAEDYVNQSRARETGRQTVADYAKGILDANEALRYELSLMGMGEQAREVALEQYRVELELKRQIAAVNANAGFNQQQRDEEIARLRAAAAIAKADASSKVFLENWKESVRQYDDIFRQGFADMLNNGQDGWKSFTRSLVNTFKTTVADQIYKMFAQPFVVNIVGNLMGLTGGGGAGGVAGAVAGGSSLLNTASNVGSAASFLSGNSLLSAVPGLGAIGGALSGFGTALTASIQSLVGITGTTSQMVASLAAAGHVAAPGVAAGVQAASLIPGWGWALAGVGALFGGDIISGLFGRKLKDQGIEGTFGGETDFEGRTYQYYKGGLFRSNKTRYGELDEDLRSGLADQFGALQAGTSEMAKILGLGTDAIDNFTASIKISFNGLDEAGIQNALKAEFEKIAESLSSQTLGTTEFTRNGETAVQTLGRLSGSLSAVNGVFENLSQTLYASSLAGADMASQLVDLFGGADGFNSATGSYFQNFYSEDEQRAAMQRQLQAALDKLDLTLPDIDAADARAQWRAQAEALDLTTEAGRKAWAVLIQLSGAFAGITQSAEEAAAAAAAQARQAEASRTKEEDLQIQLLRAQGNELAAVAIERRREMDALAQFGPAAQDIQRHIWAIIDATAQLQAGADAYFADVDRKAAEQGYVNDAQAAIDKMFGSVSAQAQAAAQAQASAAQAAAASWRSAASSIQSSLDKLRADTTAGMDPAARLSLTRAQLGAYTTAALGGDADAASKMAGAADAFLQASEAGSITRVDYLRDRITAEAQLASVLESSEAKASVQESIAAAANATVSELQALNANLTGFAGALYEILGKGYQGADRGAAQTVAESFAKMQADYDAYFNDLAGFGKVGNKYTDASFNGASFTKLNNNMAAFTGADGIVSYIRAGESLVEVAKRIPELRALWEKNYGIKLPAFAEGGYHAGGLRVVGERGWEIEATGPARIWNQQQIASAMRGGDNGSAQVVQALQTVSAQIERLEQRLAAIEDSNDQMAAQQDNSTDGGNAQRAEIMNVKQLAQAIKEAMA